MTTRLRSISIVLFALLIAGCATGPPLTTASGHPEVTISGVAAQKVQGAVIERGMSKGWILERQTENAITFLRPTNNALASILLASNYDTNVKERIRYTTVSVGGAVKLYATVEFVGNQGSAFEHVTPITNNNYNQGLQQSLEQIKAKVASGAG
jgi:hypothetical protein